MVKPEALTVVKSPTTQSDPVIKDILCDDILSCISALDEVIAEFDDSISYSSSSSLTSGSGTSLQKLQLSLTQASQRKEENFSRKIFNSSSVPEFQCDQIIMEDEPEPVRRLQVDPYYSPCQRSSSYRNQGIDTRLQSGIAPVKPARQGKKVNGQPHRQPTQPFQIEPHGPKTNGNHLSYGIVFPKDASHHSPNHAILNNNNLQCPTIPPMILHNSKIQESIGASTGNSVPGVKINKSVETCRQSPKSVASSPQKPIPVTFVMKPEDLERFLEHENEEDWNCHIEKNLPRSLRKTRKTCFVEDDEEEQEKYCRSPKDFRKNLGTASPKQSPLLNQRRPSVTPDQVVSDTRAIPTQWMRYEDANALRLQETTKASPPCPVNNNNVRNLNDLFPRKGKPPQRLSPPVTSPPTTLDQVLDIDDGYLSMINRHEAPLLWPEGGIETETFSADELKRLSVSNMNYLNVSGRGAKEQDYFSDDSLEFDGDGQVPPSKNSQNFQSDKVSSFICASSAFPPVVVQPYINKSSTRKSWSPASEIRVPGKPAINTNTWRKGAVTLDETSEEGFVKATSPVRKPCAFFIPMHNPEVKLIDESVELKSKEIQRVSSTSSLEFKATRITREILESGMQEAACINALLASPPNCDEVNGNIYETVDECVGELVSVDLRSSPGRVESLLVNSSLGLLHNESTQGELETTSSSSGIDYETSSEGRERFLDSLQGIDLEPPKHVTPPQHHQSSSPQRRHPDDIEDLYENPPPFIPPPPEVVKWSSPVPLQHSIGQPDPITDSHQRNSVARNSAGSGSEKDYFPDTFPVRVAGERPLRTQRQTSRSHENLLDINRTEATSHPCVRRGHSATLPSNAIAPQATRRPSALRQFFGIFRRNKKPSNSSAPGILNHKDLGGSLSLDDDPTHLPDHFSPYKVSRPSVSDSHGSQRSSTSKSSKRGVLSRIFRRKEK